MVYAQAINNVLAKVARRFGQKAAQKPTPAGKHDDIFQAAARGDRTAVERFLTANPHLLSARDKLGAGPLHLAAANGDLETAALLITHGVDIDTQDVTGATPLHLAVLGGPEALVRLLIDAGADVNARTKHDVTALVLARMYGRAAVANRLWAAGGTE